MSPKQANSYVKPQNTTWQVRVLNNLVIFMTSWVNKKSKDIYSTEKEISQNANKIKIYLRLLKKYVKHIKNSILISSNNKK